jgi:transposase-like protein
MGKEIQKVNAKRKRQRFSKEFKLAAVKLLQSGTKPGTLIAMELGIQRHLLYKWAETLKRHNGNIETVFQGPGRNKLGKHHDPLKAEISKLKRELARVTEERDILKKAEAYFAKVHK